jgi:carboxyl-terminal processing protease
MSTFEALLIIATALALIIQFFYKLPKTLARWLDFVPAALLIYTLILILFSGFHSYMIVVYIIVLVIFLQTVKRMIRPSTTHQPTRWRLVSAVLGLVLGVVGLVVGIIAGPMIASGAAENLSRKSWTESFERTNDILAQRYAFSEWKQIDWQSLQAEFAPRIAAAEEGNDLDAYHLALQEYFFSIPDSHIKFGGGDMRLWQDMVGGGYGLGLIELEDGSVILHQLSTGGPADLAGISWGAAVLAWDGLPVQQAISQVAPIWWEVPPATQEGRRYVQQTLLTRTAVGTQVDITFQNHDDTESRTVSLTAVDDGLQPLFEAFGWWDEMKLRQAMSERRGEPLAFTGPTALSVCAVRV